jgi:hypothetical protein
VFSASEKVAWTLFEQGERPDLNEPPTTEIELHVKSAQAWSHATEQSAGGT